MIKGDILVSKKKLVEFDIINKYIAGKVKREDVCSLLQVSSRTVSRKASRIKVKGVAAILHGNKNKTPFNKIPEEIKNIVTELVKQKYYDFNMKHCLEVLKERHNLVINYYTFRRWCHDIKLVKHKHRRRTKIYRTRNRMPNEGYLLQMDGSPHKWFGNTETVLIGAIDDATSDIPYAEFFNAEDTINCMTVLQRIIERKGIPYAIYVDKAGWFGGAKRTNFSQFKRACEELGITIIFANSPQAKGRIERAWKTFQDRLIPEMRIRNIRKFNTANDFLINQFLPNYWKKNCTVVPTSLELAYKKLPEHIDLNQVFCLKEFRQVNAAHCISWNSVFYKIISPIKFPLYKHYIELRTYQNGTWKAFFADTQVELEDFVNNQKNDDSKQKFKLVA